MSIKNYHTMPRDIPEGCRSHTKVHENLIYFPVNASNCTDRPIELTKQNYIPLYLEINMFSAFLTIHM
jgi:hypothetical protein